MIVRISLSATDDDGQYDCEPGFTYTWTGVVDNPDDMLSALRKFIKVDSDGHFYKK